MSEGAGQATEVTYTWPAGGAVSIAGVLFSQLEVKDDFETFILRCLFFLCANYSAAADAFFSLIL